MQTLGIGVERDSIISQIDQENLASMSLSERLDSGRGTLGEMGINAELMLGQMSNETSEFGVLKRQ